MTRENKLALIVGFSLLLVVAVLLADHLSPAQRGEMATLGAPLSAGPEMTLPAGNGETGRRQFGAGVESTMQPSVPPVRLTNPQSALQYEQSGGESAERDTRMGESGNQPRREFDSGPGPVSETSGVIEMGTPPSVEPQAAIDRGDATPYIVQERDTLYGLCKRFYGDGGLYEKLAKFNEDVVPTSGRIREGQKLWIPSRQILDGRGSSTPPSRATPPAERVQPSVKTVSYTIREDDRLWDIAKEHLGKGHRWPEIVDLNKDIIKNADVLPIGKTIRIPAK